MIKTFQKMGCYLDEGFRCELPAKLMGVLCGKEGKVLSKEQTRAQVGKYRFVCGKVILEQIMKG
jgi:hypothetical protein